MPVILYMDYKKQVGLVIKFYREKARLSQEALGFEVKVSQQQINDYEHGISGVSMDKMIILAKVLNIPMSEFFKDEKARKEFLNFTEVFGDYGEVAGVLHDIPHLVEVIKFYGKNAKSLKELDLLKLLINFSKKPKEAKATLAKSLYGMLKGG